MTQKLRKFSRISVYALTLLLTSVFSFYLQFKNNKTSDQKIALIPPVPTAHADIPSGGDDSDSPSECAACSCTCSDDADDAGGDDAGDDSDGDGGDF